ncbi:MAG TPA: sugar phosphate isomerase/epimerase family protein [Terriglobales bacterium]|nr:sugar phosphate isomerase/epimerase family protein [Terriglobales bacterium]
MRKAISSYVFVKQRLHPGLLDCMVRAGAEAIEIFGARDHFDYTNRAMVREIAGWFRSSGIAMNSMHSPMFSDYEWGKSGTPPVNVVDPDKRRRIESMDEIKRAIETAEILPFQFLVQHIGNGGEAWDPRKFDHAMTSLEHLRAFARPLGVTLLVENIPNELSTPEKLIDLLKAAHLNDVGVCFDVGHAHMTGKVAEAFAVLKPHIRSTHLHDNRGDKDTHLWPGDGTIKWEEVTALLRTAPQVPPLLLEIDGEEQENPALERKLAEALRKLDAVPATRN